MTGACSLLLDAGDGLSGGSGGSPAVDSGPGPFEEGGTPPADAGTLPDAAGDAPDSGVDPYAAAVLGDEPVLYYRFEESGERLTAVDSSVSGRVGTYSLAIDRTRPGRFGHGLAAHFEGTTVLNAGGAGDFRGKTPFTVEVWLRPDLLSGFRHVLGRPEASPSDNGYRLLIDGANVSFLRGQTYCFVSGGPGFVTTTEFTHVVATYDGASSRLYKDGQLIASTTEGASLTANLAFVVGGGGEDFIGDLDELALYDRALSPERIALHSALGR